MKDLKVLVKAGLRKTGFELRRYTIQTSADAQLIRTLTHFDVDLVLDVGVNVGQYGSALREHGYRRRIVSFEPSSTAHAELLRCASGDPDWTIAPRMALGASPGVAILNLAGNSVSNSIRSMLPSHEQAAPDSVFFGTEQVPVQTLDSLAPEYLLGTRCVLLKIDTQGFEDAVLAGAGTCLDRVTAVQIELSLISLYKDQMLFDETRDRLNVLGFDLYSLYPVYSDERTGRTLQVDGLFVRRDLAGS